MRSSNITSAIGWVNRLGNFRSYIYNPNTIWKAKALIPTILRKILPGLTSGKEFTFADADLDSIEWVFVSRIKVKRRDGKVLEEFQRVPKGAERGEKWGETKGLVERKFIDEVGRRLGPNKAKEAMRSVLSIDKITDGRDFIESFLKD